MTFLIDAPALPTGVELYTLMSAIGKVPAAVPTMLAGTDCEGRSGMEMWCGVRSMQV